MTKTSAIRVRTRFESVDDFVVGYSPFFDARGVFIRTRRLQEIGTRMRFELQLADGSSVFRGEGIVDEVRQPPLSAAGMHVRISKLDRLSKELFERMTGDLEHVGSDPFEAPTYDPERPGFDLVEAARVLAAASGSYDTVDEAPDEGPVPGLIAMPGAEDESGFGLGEGSPLDAGVLDEIADGIEFSLDSVWEGTSFEAAGTADLGGYFGSPDVLAKAGLTPVAGQRAVSEPSGQTFEPAQAPPQAAEPVAPAPVFSPPVDEDDLDQELFASGEVELVSDRDPFDLSGPQEAVPATDSDLGLDLSLAHASNYAPDPVVAESADDYAAEIEAQAADEAAEAAEAEEAHETYEAEAAYEAKDEDEADNVFVSEELLASLEPARAKRHTSDEPDLQTLARTTLEHDVIDTSIHRRYSFATEEQTSGLGNLLRDMIETGGEKSGVPDLDIAALTGEHEAQDFSESGPDAIDELLARESAAETPDDKRPGFFGRLFGKKKK